jgi:hypothetical protein
MIEALTLSLALALAGAPADLSLTLAAEEPAPVQCADASLARVLSPALLALGDIGQQSVTCTEDCGGLPSVSCSGNTCSAVTRNCPSQVGYVVCDGVYKYCGACQCTNGNHRIERTNECCDCSFGGAIREYQTCVNGVWEVESTFCGPSGACPICP